MRKIQKNKTLKYFMLLFSVACSSNLDKECSSKILINKGAYDISYQIGKTELRFIQRKDSLNIFRIKGYNIEYQKFNNGEDFYINSDSIGYQSIYVNSDSIEFSNFQIKNKLENGNVYEGTAFYGFNKSISSHLFLPRMSIIENEKLLKIEQNLIGNIDSIVFNGRINNDLVNLCFLDGTTDFKLNDFYILYDGWIDIYHKRNNEAGQFATSIQIYGCDIDNQKLNEFCDNVADLKKDYDSIKLPIKYI